MDNNNPTIFRPPDDLPYGQWLQWVTEQIVLKYEEFTANGNPAANSANINIEPNPDAAFMVGYYTRLYWRKRRHDE